MHLARRKNRISSICLKNFTCFALSPTYNRCTLPLYPTSMSYVVASAIKDFLKKQGMMTAGEFPEAASAYLEEALKGAAKRAKDNGRVTVRPYDL